ncbi:hypothetical protein DEA8626_02316 [Defluviimonas aquaemixtae]|uniref:Uncharacterized protein n=1 Tax=Albidovulum aquaemixtae TaxID=1542388 RepID=A0A2R8B865_9RHOB|nr:hypothetical protein DEA8626_02316 [Defluviimonas aquaemixtae]
MPSEIVRFAVLRAPRTGPTLLSNHLDLTPGVHCQFELIREHILEFRQLNVKDSDEIARREGDPVGFLQHVFWEADTADHTVARCKRFGQLPRQVARYLADRKLSHWPEQS